MANWVADARDKAVKKVTDEARDEAEGRKSPTTTKEKIQRAADIAARDTAYAAEKVAASRWTGLQVALLVVGGGALAYILLKKLK
jgi:hypothetical protein